jgi:hypothetical protein
MTSTIQFVYYLVCVGMLIAGLRLAEVRPTTEWTLLLGWPGLMLVSVWFFGSYLPTLRGWRARARSESGIRF